MLSIFLIWIYIAFLSFPYGLFWLKLVAKAGNTDLKTVVPIEIILVAGSGVLSVLIGILHLWLSISVTIHIIVFVGSLYLLGRFKDKLRPFFKSQRIAAGYILPYSVLLFIFSVLILIHAAQPAINPDTGLYHAQTIQWYNKYRIVPGLGNLFGPLALNSHAHLLMSLFSFSFFTTKILYQSWGSFIFLLYSSYALREGFDVLKTRPSFSIYYFGSLFWGLVFFRDWISSPTPDTVVMFFLLFMFGVLLMTDRSRKINWQVAFIFFLLPVLVSFKLSALFGCIIGLAWLILFYKRLNFALIKFAGLQSLIVFLPYFIRNLILSGHLLFPLPILDLFNLDWEVPQIWVIIYKEGIAAYSRVPTAEWSYYIDKPFIDWFKIWWINQNRPDKVFLTILGILFPFITWQVIRDIARKSEPVLCILWLSAFIASIAWFCTAPAVRFGYGYLVPILLIGIILLIRTRISTMAGLSVGLFMGLYGMNGIYNQINRAAFSLVWPADYRKPVIEVMQIGNVKTRVASGDGRCWNEPLPCTMPDPHPGLEMRGKKLEDGFRTVVKNIR